MADPSACEDIPTKPVGACFNLPGSACYQKSPSDPCSIITANGFKSGKCKMNSTGSGTSATANGCDCVSADLPTLRQLTDTKPCASDF